MTELSVRETNPHNHTPRLVSEKRGLTLLELIVVLAILAAVAAIVVPLLPNLLRRAHKSVDATQSSELAKSIQMYHALYNGYPDNFDALVDSAGVFPNYIPNDDAPGTPFGGFVTATALTEAEQKALGRVGITRVQLFSTTLGSGQHPTMNPYAGAITGTAINDGNAQSTQLFCTLNKTAIATANPSFLQAEFASDPTARYVVFGVGPRCTMVNKVIQDAPTSVPQNAGLTPDRFYCRVGAIFKVSGTEVSRTDRARFIGCVAMEDDELETTEKDIVGYYEVVNDANP